MSAVAPFPAGSPLRHRLEAFARTERLVVFAGIPGVGKSLLVRQLARLACEQGRRVHLFQWDVARAAFETPALLARYPEVDGITHPAIRAAVGLWIRDAIGAWDIAHPGTEHLLIGEAPLVGRRFLELVEPAADAAEALLGGPRSRFLVPVPSREVRRAIEARRAATSAQPAHAREAADASPRVVLASWSMVVREGIETGLLPAAAGGEMPYDPAAYRTVYLHWLRHRRAEAFTIDELLPVEGSVYDVGAIAGELAASPEAVEAFAARVASRAADVR